jgi:hypothetical protein
MISEQRDQLLVAFLLVNVDLRFSVEAAKAALWRGRLDTSAFIQSHFVDTRLKALSVPLEHWGRDWIPLHGRRQ